MPKAKRRMTKLRSPAFTGCGGRKLVRVLARIEGDKAGAGSPNLAKNGAILGKSRSELQTRGIRDCGLVIVRHQFPCCHEPGAK
jgi:hypothetical protein